MVCTVNNACGTTEGALRVVAEHLSIDQGNTGTGSTITSGNTADTDAIVINGSDGAGDVSSVTGCIVDISLTLGVIVLIKHEVEASLYINMTCKVGMLVINTAIHDTDDDIGLPGLHLPGREEVDVSSGDTMGVLMTIVVVVPLGGEQGVIKAVYRSGGISLTKLSELLSGDRCDLRLRRSHCPLELYRLKALRGLNQSLSLIRRDLTLIGNDHPAIQPCLVTTRPEGVLVEEERGHGDPA